MVFALETILEHGSTADVGMVILYSAMTLMRIVFEGYRFVMLLPWLVPDEEPQYSAHNIAHNIAQTEHGKRESCYIK